MKVTVTFIRNAVAEGSREGRYLGLTDEPLSDWGEERLRDRINLGVYPEVQIVFSGALSRCRQTAQLIYPRTPAILLRELAAFDYGDFTGKDYGEVISDPRFSDWAAAGRLLPCPGGEEPYVFMNRCNMAFRQIASEMQSKELTSAAVVTHETVIKTILQRYCSTRSLYRDWTVDYGGGYTVCCDMDSGVLRLTEKIL